MSAILSWASRRAGGLAMLFTFALSYYVVTREAHASPKGYKKLLGDSLGTDDIDPWSSGAGFFTVIFAYYCTLIHTLVVVFPVRSCYSIFDMTRNLKKTARSKSLKEYKLAHQRRGSSASLSSSETLTSSREGSLTSTTESDAGDLEPEFYPEGEVDPDRVIHAIVVPNYKEEVDTLRETLEVLASHPQARATYDIYLGMEQREHNAELKAMNLIQEFVKKFRSIDFTMHPSDIPGESPGKGSNMAWAARRLSEKYNKGKRKDVLITGIDGMFRTFSLSVCGIAQVGNDN
jgi:hypothetical protein